MLADGPERDKSSYWRDQGAQDKDVDLLTKWVTLGGAVIGAVSGVWALRLQIRGKRDQILVSMGTLTPDISPETMLSVVSKCDHSVQIVDYGFIETSGQLTSIPLEIELGKLHHPELSHWGSTLLSQRGGCMQMGYIRSKRTLGCFARSNLQERPCLAFSPDTSQLKRIQVRLLVWRAGSCYLNPR